MGCVDLKDGATFVKATGFLHWLGHIQWKVRGGGTLKTLLLGRGNCSTNLTPLFFLMEWRILFYFIFFLNVFFLLYSPSTYDVRTQTKSRGHEVEKNTTQQLYVPDPATCRVSFWKLENWRAASLKIKMYKYKHKEQ